MRAYCSRGARYGFTVRLVNRCVALPERIMRVRIKESSFCLRALRATLASFRMAAAMSTLAHVPTTSSGGEKLAYANRYSRLQRQRSSRKSRVSPVAITVTYRVCRRQAITRSRGGCQDMSQRRPCPPPSGNSQALPLRHGDRMNFL